MKKRGWLSGLAVVAVVAAGCSNAASSGTTSPGGSQTTSGNTNAPSTTLAPKNGGILNVGLGAETDGWNPTSDQWASQGYTVAQTIFDPLMAYDSSGVAVPYLAKTVTHSSNFETWTIGLRPGIKFSNRQSCNAAAVALQLTKDKQSALVGQSLLPMVSATATNNLTVVVKMNEPWVGFPAVLAGQPGYIAAPAQLDSGSSTQPIGTGPFIFKQWIQNQTLTVVANPHYWQKGLPHVHEIIFHVITDPTTMLEALQSGQLQLMATAQASQIKSLEGQTQYHYYIQHLQTPVFIMLDTDSPPFNNIDIRKALEYDTNQQQIINTIDLGLGSVATEPYAPGSPWYVPSGYPTKPNVSLAESYVKKYHQATHTSGPVKFTLGCVPSTTNQESMDLLIQQWKAIGIDATLSMTEQSTYIDDAVLGNYQANCWTQFGSIDPDADALWWLCSNAKPNGQIALNFARECDPTTDKELQIGRTHANYAVRKAAYGKVWKEFAKDAQYIWLARGPDMLVWSPDLEGMGDAVYPGGQKQDSLGSPISVPITQLWLTNG